MISCTRVLCLLALTLPVALGGSALPAQDPAADGWVDLLKGDTLDGWRFYFGPDRTENDGTFTLKDGVLVCTGRPGGYIYSDKSYSNYTLQLEWAFKRPEGLEDDAQFRGNSGYLIHITEHGALGVWPRSIEVQGAHNHAGSILPIPRDVKCKHTMDREALARVLKPVGQWNAIEIEVKGEEMVISVNGTEVSTVSDCELTEGPFGLQSEGAQIHWRNIRIRQRD